MGWGTLGPEWRQNSVMRIEQISPARADVRDLIRQSDEHLAELYPPESNHLESSDDLTRLNVLMLGVFNDGALIGIGAVKILVDDVAYGEIKRVFVTPEFRGQGISKMIMEELERRLIENQIGISRLETGIAQPEAIGLYKGLGYIERSPFGAYQDDPLSVFMEKIFDVV